MKTNLTQAMVTALAMLNDAVAMEAKYPGAYSRWQSTGSSSFRKQTADALTSRGLAVLKSEDLRFGVIYRLYAITPAGLAAITKAEED
tara:strand:+ start:345 stop:608 length:264 start_codon:yes stop_codon:yes gene_type:complete